MSRRTDLQSARPERETLPGYGNTRIVTNGAPTDSQAGYTPGCTWQNVGGTAGSVFYVNVGTKTSSNWLNIC